MRTCLININKGNIHWKISIFSIIPMINIRQAALGSVVCLLRGVGGQQEEQDTSEDPAGQEETCQEDKPHS